VCFTFRRTFCASLSFRCGMTTWDTSWVNHHLVVRGEAALVRRFQKANYAAPTLASTHDVFAAPSDPSWGLCATPPTEGSRGARFTSLSPRGAPRTLCFSRAIPVPSELLSQPYTPHGFEWEQRHWGTPWGPQHCVMTPRRGGVTYAFLTENNLPLPWFLALVAQWPTLRFEWWAREDTNAFLLSCVAEQGTVTSLTDWMRRLCTERTSLSMSDLAPLLQSPFREDVDWAIAAVPAALADPSSRRRLRRLAKEWCLAGLGGADMWGRLTAAATGRLRSRMLAENLERVMTRGGFGPENSAVEWLQAFLDALPPTQEPADLGPADADAKNGDAPLDSSRAPEDSAPTETPLLHVSRLRGLPRAHHRAIIRAFLLSRDKETRLVGSRLSASL